MNPVGRPNGSRPTGTRTVPSGVFGDSAGAGAPATRWLIGRPLATHPTTATATAPSHQSAPHKPASTHPSRSTPTRRPTPPAHPHTGSDQPRGASPYRHQTGRPSGPAGIGRRRRDPMVAPRNSSSEWLPPKKGHFRPFSPIYGRFAQSLLHSGCTPDGFAGGSRCAVEGLVTKETPSTSTNTSARRGLLANWREVRRVSAKFQQI